MPASIWVLCLHGWGIPHFGEQGSGLSGVWNLAGSAGLCAVPHLQAAGFAVPLCSHQGNSHFQASVQATHPSVNEILKGRALDKLTLSPASSSFLHLIYRWQYLLDYFVFFGEKIGAISKQWQQILVVAWLFFPSICVSIYVIIAIPQIASFQGRGVFQFCW